MRKDIEIPVVKDLFFAVIQEQHLDYKTLDWNAYIINNSDEDLEVVLILSKGYSKEKMSSEMRHQIPLLPARSYAKVEYLQEDVLMLNNSFKVTFFKNNQMFEKAFTFEQNSINNKAFQNIPLMNVQGVLRQ